MKLVSRIFILVLTLALLLSFAACGKDSAVSQENDNPSDNSETTDQEENAPTVNVLEQAKAAIEKQDYDTAYNLLYALEAPSAEEAALLKCFSFLTESQTLEISFGTRNNTFFHNYTYDERGNILTYETNHLVGDDRVEKTTYTYDEKNNPIKEIVTGGINDRSTTYTNTYDEKGQLIKVDAATEFLDLLNQVINGSEPSLATTTYTYDDQGHMLTYTFTDGINNEKKVYTYLGDLVLSYSVTDSDNKTESYLYQYDIAGNLIMEQELDGDQILYTYDEQGNLINTQDGKHTTVCTYDTNGNMLSEIVTYDGEARRDATYTYDEQGNLIEKKSSSGAITTYAYDSYGNLLTSTETFSNEKTTITNKWTLLYHPSFAEEVPAPKLPTDASVLTQAKILIENGDYAFAYSMLHSLETPSEEEAALLNRFSFLPVKEENSGDFKTSYPYTNVYTYNEKGQLIKKEETARYRDPIVTTYTYDNHGNIQMETNETDDTWVRYHYTYDDKGNILIEQFTDSDNLILDYLTKTVYTYDNYGNVLTKDYYKREIDWYTDEDGGRKGNYRWDPNGWEKYSYTYDDNGNMLTMDVTENIGHLYLITFTYDSHGNVLTKEIADGSIFACNTTYTYDETGKFLLEEKYTEKDYELLCVYTYDDNGALISQRTTVNGTITKDLTFTNTLFYNPQ